MAPVNARCDNCGAERPGSYCAYCGQNSRDYRGSLPRLVWAMIVEAFEVDGRLMRSLGGLFLRPGSLAQAFSANRRADFMSPARLYLFSSLLFFFVLTLTWDGPQIGDDEPVDAAQAPVVAILVEPNLTDNAAPTDSHIRAVLRPWLTEAQRQRLEGLLARDQRGGLADDVLATLAERVSRDETPARLWQRIPGLAVDALHAPELLFGNVLENLPLAMFVLLPLYALLLQLLFWGSQRFYTEHLVFALYLHVLAYLLFTVLLLLPDGSSVTALDALWENTAQRRISCPGVLQLPLHARLLRARPLADAVALSVARCRLLGAARAGRCCWCWRSVSFPSEEPVLKTQPIRPAATVMLVRDASTGIEVFLLRRTTSAAFASGMFVFPGGRVDAEDHFDKYRAVCVGPDDAQQVQATALGSDHLGYWVAAIRECFEEAGLLLAYDRHGDLLRFDGERQALRFDALRGPLHAGSLDLHQICEAEGLQLAVDRVHLFNRFVTPPGRPRRFDTRFFVAAAPPGQQGSHDREETIDSAWLTPRAALRQQADGGLGLMRVTRRQLEAIAGFDSVEALLQHVAAQSRIPVFRPEQPAD